METILTPCRVPWAVSPSMSAVTLTHAESDVGPKCSVVFGGGRLTADDLTDLRRIEITFERCYFARTGPRDDRLGIEELGYRVEPDYTGYFDDDIGWRHRQWRATGNCPISGFYVAQQSSWLSTLPKYFQNDARHYLVDGENGYVELIARCFTWQEWLWSDGKREDMPLLSSPVHIGEGIV
jgi:hypothetical protein